MCICIYVFFLFVVPSTAKPKLAYCVLCTLIFFLNSAHWRYFQISTKKSSSSLPGLLLVSPMFPHSFSFKGASLGNSESLGNPEEEYQRCCTERQSTTPALVTAFSFLTRDCLQHTGIILTYFYLT